MGTFQNSLQKMLIVTHCHARMKDILSYLHIPKTTTMCYMYEADYSD